MIRYPKCLRIKNTVVVLITYLLIIEHAVAQEAAENSIDRGIYTIVPPSPEVSAFNNYVNFSSVDQFTGKLNLNIPLFEITSGTLSFPLSLSYSSSGIRVDEESSWVGLGWSLSVGGSINRTIHGLPDDHPYGYNSYSSQINDPSFFDNLPHDEKVLAAYAYRDFEPDVYSYYVGGLISGSFIEKLPEQYVSVPATDDDTIKFNKDTWKIKNPNGVMFIFGPSGENCLWEGDYRGNEVQYKSAWYLKEIISPSGTDRIQFTYGNATQNQTSNHVQTIVKANSGSDLCGHEPSRFFNSTFNYYGAQLTSIISKNVRLDFHLKNRTDIDGTTRALDKIVITDLITDKTREIVFDSKEYGSVSGGPEKRRLVLDAVIIKSEDGSLKYSMEYNGLDLLPDKDSWSIDHWGFYNGKSNSGLIPFQMHNGVGVGNADREPDLVKSQYGLLSKLVYPTGGWMEIEYEPHSYSKVRYIEVDELAFTRNEFIGANTENGNESKVLHLAYSQDVGVFSQGSGLICPPVLDGTFVSIKDLSGHEFYKKLFTSSNESENINIALDAGSYILEAIRECSSESAFIRINYASNPPDTIKQKSGGGVRVKKIRSNSLDQGILEKSYLYANSSGISSGMLHGMPVYSYSQHLIEWKSLVDGELVTWVPHKECLVTNYSSVSKHNLGFANGSHVSYDFVTEFSGEIGNSGKTQTTFYNCANQYTLAFPFPADISNDWKRGHPILIETFDNVNNLIKRVSFDYSLTSQLGQNNYYDTIKGIKVGIIKDYSKNNTLIQDYEVYNYYHVSASRLINQKVTVDYFNSGQINTIEDYAYNLDNQLLKIRERVISGDDVLTKNFKYPHDYNELLLSSDEMSLALDSLRTKNMIYTPIEITGSLNAKVTSGQLMLYKKDDHGNINLSEINQLEINNSLDEQGFIGSYVSEIGQFVKNEFFIPNIEILMYDSTSNVLEFKDNKMKYSFYWGYNSNFPVIKASNVEFITLVSAVRESLPAGFFNLDDLLMNLKPYDSILKTFNENLRSHSKMKDVLINTYTYSPLMGMTSQTDPNGITTYYEYDGLGRLTRILDNDRNVLQEHKYNYFTSQ
jgi:YD repeat-containing protein